eukprot:COSAG01_NODE_6591_length_3589_cov_13.533524_2_plen_166_part_00
MQRAGSRPQHKSKLEWRTVIERIAPYVVASERRSLLPMAVKHGQFELARLLLKPSHQVRGLCSAIEQPDVDILNTYYPHLLHEDVQPGEVLARAMAKMNTSDEKQMMAATIYRQSLALAGFDTMHIPRDVAASAASAAVQLVRIEVALEAEQVTTGLICCTTTCR